MDMILNSLPTRTWNHLGMNETKLSVAESIYDNHCPEVSFDSSISWNPSASWDNSLPEIKNGMGKDMKAITSQASIGLAETAEGVRMEKPMILKWSYADGEKSVSRVVLHAEKNSVLSAIMVLSSESELSEGFSAVRTEIYADENAVVNLYVAQLLGADTLCFNDISGICKDNAQINLVKLELGSGKLYAGTQIDLMGVNSSFNTDIGYHVLENQVLDMNYVANHFGAHTSSHMNVSGTLDENSRKIFRGTIDFKRGCTSSSGTENENVLLLGDNMVNQTIPLILCQEEDVEGNHGASIGKLDDKVLFYLASRGFSEREAQQLIARSRIEAVCQKIPDEDIQAQIREYEDKRGSNAND